MSATAKRAKPYRLTPPVVPEHSLQKQICDVLRLEIAPPGKVSKAGVCWYSIDMAAYSGEVPGIRIGRGVVAGVPDVFLTYRGRAHFIEIKTDADTAVLSLAQQSVCTALLAAGGRVGVVTNTASVLECLDTWQVPRAYRVRI